MNHRSFELEEFVQLDDKSWLRILVGVGLFLIFSVACLAIMAFVPMPRRLSPEISGPFWGALVLFASIFLSKQMTSSSSVARQAPIRFVTLSATEIKIKGSRGRTVVIENEGLNLIQSTRTTLEFESPKFGRFEMPAYVRFKSSETTLVFVLKKGKLYIAKPSLNEWSTDQDVIPF